MAEQNRTPRSQETRAADMRQEYTPPNTLPTPEADADFGFRWVAAYVLGERNQSNVSQKFREGWVPVKAADHPELHMPANKAGEVEIGGLILCKAPIQMIEARARYYANQTQGQMAAVDNSFMKQNDPRMPVLPRESRTGVTRGTESFGSGIK